MKTVDKLAQLQEWLEGTKDAENRSDAPGDEFDSLLRETAPSGSGFNCGTRFEGAKFSKSGDCVAMDFETDFHIMNENGYYVGWATYRIRVTPTFGCFAMRVRGPKALDLREYVEEVFWAWLESEIKEESEQ